MLVLLFGLLNTPSRTVIAQARGSRVDTLVASIPMNTRLRVLTREFQPVEYRLATKRSTAVGLYMPGRERPLSLAQVDSLWVHVNMTEKVSGIGSIVMGVGGAVALSSTVCERGCVSQTRMDAVLLGGAVGVLVGAAIGAVIGASLDTWHLRYARAGPVDTPPPAQP
jgi:hypothetical protein